MKTYSPTKYLWLLVKQRLRSLTLKEAITSLAVLALLYLALRVIETVMESIIYLLLLYPLIQMVIRLFDYLRRKPISNNEMK